MHKRRLKYKLEFSYVVEPWQKSKTLREGAWKDGSLVRNTSWSCRRPQVSSQWQCLAPHDCLKLLLQGIRPPFLASVGTGTHVQVLQFGKHCPGFCSLPLLAERHTLAETPGHHSSRTRILDQTPALPGSCFLTLCWCVSIGVCDMSIPVSHQVYKELVVELSGGRWMCTETNAVQFSSVPGVYFPSLACSDAGSGRDGGPHSHAGSRENEDSGDLSAFCVSLQKQPSLGQHILRKALCKAHTYCSIVNSFCWACAIHTWMDTLGKLHSWSPCWEAHIRQSVSRLGCGRAFESVWLRQCEAPSPVHSL